MAKPADLISIKDVDQTGCFIFRIQNHRDEENQP